MFCLAINILERLGMGTCSAFSQAQVWRCLESVVDRADADLAAEYCVGELSDPAAFVVPKMALLYAVMEHCQLPIVSFQLATGSCAGLLVSNEWYQPRVSGGTTR